MKIEIYTKSNCPHCTQAKALLDSKGLAYTSYSLQEDTTDSQPNQITRNQLLDLFPETRTMPQIMIDDKPIGGLQQLRQHLSSI